MSEVIYKNSCWGCKRAQEDESYICPKMEQHWDEYRKREKKLNILEKEVNEFVKEVEFRLKDG